MQDISIFIDLPYYRNNSSDASFKYSNKQQKFKLKLSSKEAAQTQTSQSAGIIRRLILHKCASCLLSALTRLPRNEWRGVTKHCSQITALCRLQARVQTDIRRCTLFFIHTHTATVHTFTTQPSPSPSGTTPCTPD